MKNILYSLLFCLWVPHIYAAEVLNATFFPQEHLSIEFQWLLPELRSSNDKILDKYMVGETGLTELRLTIPSEYIGSNKKIFLVAPKQIPGIRDQGLEIRWESRGTFINGMARPGERVLLYQGPLNGAMLSGDIAFTFKVDSNFLYGQMDFQPKYELE